MFFSKHKSIFFLSKIDFPRTIISPSIMALVELNVPANHPYFDLIMRYQEALEKGGSIEQLASETVSYENASGVIECRIAFQVALAERLKLMDKNPQSILGVKREAFDDLHAYCDCLQKLYNIIRVSNKCVHQLWTRAA
jgi:hypothetical protein